MMKTSYRSGKAMLAERCIKKIKINFSAWILNEIVGFELNKIAQLKLLFCSQDKKKFSLDVNKAARETASTSSTIK